MKFLQSLSDKLTKNKMLLALINLILIIAFVVYILQSSKVSVDIFYLNNNRHAEPPIGSDFTNYIEGEDKILLKEGKNILRIPLDPAKINDEFLTGKTINMTGSLVMPDKVARLFYATSNDKANRKLLYDSFLNENDPILKTNGIDVYSIEQKDGSQNKAKGLIDLISGNYKIVDAGTGALNTVDIENKLLSVPKPVFIQESFRDALSFNIYYEQVDKEMVMRFKYDDLNFSDERDNISIEVFNPRGEVIYQDLISDESDSGVVKSISKDLIYSIEAPIEQTGIYRVEIKGTGDNIFHDIEMFTSYYDFGNVLYTASNKLYRQNDKPAKLIAKCERLEIEVLQKDVILDVYLNDFKRTVRLNEPVVVRDLNYKNIRISSDISNFRVNCSGGSQARIYQGEVIPNVLNDYNYYDIQDVLDLRAYDFVVANYKKLRKQSKNSYEFSVELRNYQTDESGFYVELYLLSLENINSYVLIDNLNIEIK